MFYLHERIIQLCKVLDQRRFQDQNELSLEYCLCGYKDVLEMPAADTLWQPLTENSTFNYDASDDRSPKNHGWMRGRFVKTSREGYHACLRNETFGCDSGSSAQYMVYIDGKLISALDWKHCYVTLDDLADGEHELLIYFYLNLSFIRCPRFVFSFEDEAVSGLYWDVRVPLDVLLTIDPDSRTYGTMLQELSDALSLVDFRRSSEAFRAGVIQARAKLDAYFRAQDPSDKIVASIGHTHIDVAWKWTYAQTREKVQRTFSTMIHLLETYPEYKFMSSQAQLYEFMKEECPDLYEKIKQFVAQGRWEVEGAMWVEADTNLPSGESLVRQLLYGKRFFKQEFGIDSKVLWLPDVFGYSGALPQILRKSGVDSFVTSKISWNEINQAPFDVFDWKGIDGTGIFSWFLTTQMEYRDRAAENFTTYNGVLTAPEVMGTWKRFQQKELADTVLTTYGYGDGGGGPNPEMIEQGKRMNRGIPSCPKVEFSFAGDFLKKVKKETEASGRRPVWDGELYFEYHRGTYTSQARNKKNNRKAEYLLTGIEKAAFLRDRIAQNTDAEKKKALDELLHRSWKTVLINQFHDVIPGSSIHDVYQDTDRMYAELFGEARKAYADVLQYTLPDSMDRKKLAVWNPNAFEGGAELRQADGSYVYVSSLPSLGTAWVEAEENRPVLIDEQSRCAENDFYRVLWNEKGQIESILDKRADREVLKAPANVLRAYEDYPRNYDAWEISEYYTEKVYSVEDLRSFEAFEEGDRAGFLLKYRFNQSEIIQKIALYGHSPRIDFETELDWHEDHILLKTDFPIDVRCREVTCNIQFGDIKRPAYRNTSWDAAKFEICAHRYADLSENGYGAALLNDCKYGYSVKDTTLSLSLLKCATMPDPAADQGYHSFTYSFLPHIEDLYSAGVLQEAYLLNDPPVILPAVPEEKKSMLQFTQDNLFCDALKYAEDPNADGKRDAVVRLYEAFGRRFTGKVRFGFPVRRAFLCDMMENKERELPLEENAAVLSLRPFELTALRLELAD